MQPYYQSGGITIYHGDARDVLPSLVSASIDLILTDPPYGHNNNNGDLANRWEAALGIAPKGWQEAPNARPIANDGPEANDLVRWMFGEAARLLKHGCCCCCCCGGGGPDPQFARWSLWLDETVGFKQAVVWDKGGLGMGWHYRRNYELMLVGEKPGAACKWYGDRRQPNVIRLPGIKPTEDDHPTPKPVALMAKFINLHSAPGDLILDPFMGGGSTVDAARQLGRRIIAVEIDERWCEIATRRLAQDVLPLGV